MDLLPALTLYNAKTTTLLDGISLHNSFTYNTKDDIGNTRMEGTPELSSDFSIRDYDCSHSQAKFDLFNRSAIKK